MEGQGPSMNLTAKGNVHRGGAVRQRFWKNEALNNPLSLQFREPRTNEARSRATTPESRDRCLGKNGTSPCSMIQDGERLRRETGLAGRPRGLSIPTAMWGNETRRCSKSSSRKSKTSGSKGQVLPRSISFHAPRRPFSNHLRGNEQ